MARPILACYCGGISFPMLVANSLSRLGEETIRKAESVCHGPRIVVAIAIDSRMFDEYPLPASKTTILVCAFYFLYKNVRN